MRIRTADLRITSALLYQLSYSGPDEVYLIRVLDLESIQNDGEDVKEE